MEHKKLTLGSLFDGIGGFPLAGKMAGITPIWASEIEPFPIRVTEKRLPEVKHYGDVHGLNGAEMEPVDIITFGSPCQDLSIAGRREGLSGSRSNLFHEAVRIIREMREKTNGKYPRWAVWENVPGALSSQNGQDFRCVLESLIRIKAPEADVPLPGSGKWLPAGEILGDHYSLAWRILDAAQGWGVAQRRKRIFAVLDLDGQCAGKVLFESEGMSGYTPPSGEARQGTARSAETGAGASGECDGVNLAGGFCTEHSADSRGIGYEDERAPTLRAGVVPGVAIEFNPTDSRIKIRADGVCQTLLSRMGTGGNQVPLVFGISADQSNAMLSENPHAGIYEADTSRTLDCNGGSPACNQGGMIVVEPVAFTQNQRDEVRELGGQSGTISASPGIHQQTYVAQPINPCYCIQGSMIGRKDHNGPQGDGINKEVSFTLDTIDRHAVYAMTTGSFTQVDKELAPPIMARDYKDPPVIGKDDPTYALDRACFNAGQNAQYRMNIGEERAPTLVAEGPSAVAAPTDYLVRRLTPGECCRLQGYPDGWCEDLASIAPSNKETDSWEAIFEEWRIISGSKCKPKTRRQVIRWLQNPHTDSAEYKAYGNSVAVPCVFFVLAGIVWATESEVNDHENA
ncbi:MAG: DNA cytosine methyltransferase [Clostridia bacterium]|nr:DNA cytosine methyltransferase [Clostridia bacterium]